MIDDANGKYMIESFSSWETYYLLCPEAVCLDPYFL